MRERGVGGGDVELKENGAANVKVEKVLVYVQVRVCVCVACVRGGVRGHPCLFII